MKTMIINLTQHTATPEQIVAGVMDLNKTHRKELQELLTFDECPDSYDVHRVAYIIATSVKRWVPDITTAMIGGAPFLMSALEESLRYQCITPIYAFSKRVSTTKTLPSGSVVKDSVFKHLGFVGE